MEHPIQITPEILEAFGLPRLPQSSGLLRKSSPLFYGNEELRSRS